MHIQSFGALIVPVMFCQYTEGLWDSCGLRLNGVTQSSLAPFYRSLLLAKSYVRIRGSLFPFLDWHIQIVLRSPIIQPHRLGVPNALEAHIYAVLEDAAKDGGARVACFGLQYGCWKALKPPGKG